MDYAVALLVLPLLRNTDDIGGRKSAQVKSGIHCITETQTGILLQPW